MHTRAIRTRIALHSFLETRAHRANLPLVQSVTSHRESESNKTVAQDIAIVLVYRELVEWLALGVMTSQTNWLKRGFYLSHYMIHFEFEIPNSQFRRAPRCVINIIERSTSWP